MFVAEMYIPAMDSQRVSYPMDNMFVVLGGLKRYRWVGKHEWEGREEWGRPPNPSQEGTKASIPGSCLGGKIINYYKETLIIGCE